MNLLRASTAVVVPLGVAVDKSDGFTPETGLLVGTVDELSALKHGSTTPVDLSGTSTLTHTGGGKFSVSLLADDVDTVGLLELTLRDDDVCRPLTRTFLVIAQQVYDALTGLDLLQTDVRELGGDANAPAKLARGANGLVLGAVDGVATTTTIPSDLSNTVETDQYIGRTLTFVEGPCAGEQTTVTGYDPGSRTLAVEALISAPATGNRFVIS